MCCCLLKRFLVKERFVVVFLQRDQQINLVSDQLTEAQTPPTQRNQLTSMSRKGTYYYISYYYTYYTYYIHIITSYIFLCIRVIHLHKWFVILLKPRHKCGHYKRVLCNSTLHSLWLQRQRDEHFFFNVIQSASRIFPFSHFPIFPAKNSCWFLSWID